MLRLAALILVLAALLAGCLSSTPQPRPVIATGPNRPIQSFSWQQPQAKVLAAGDLQWAPELFSLKLGKTVRYIDFQAGSDTNDGSRPTTPWKHHPWDATATERAAAGSDADTFIFKRGTIYRGVLVAGVSNRPSTPIRLTADPAWGNGEAVLQSPEPDNTSGPSSQLLPTIVIRDASNIRISGLSFRFPTAPAPAPAGDGDNLAAIRVIGQCFNIRVTNCLFQHLPAAMCATTSGKAMDQLSFNDNRVEFADREAVRFVGESSGNLKNVEILRNTIRDAGQRPAQAQASHTLTLIHPRYAHVAGNVLTRTTGIYVIGGEDDPTTRPSPITRVLVHQNKITDSLWALQGSSGIQTMGNGPFYVYDNVVSAHDSAYSFDDSFKTYVFGNIGFAGRSDPSQQPTTAAAMEEDVAHRNVFANNALQTPADGSAKPWVQVFVPWALSNIAGEWNFCRNASDPNRVRDSGWPSARSADSQALLPRYDLRGNAFRFTSYVSGPLENWTAGALSFDGVNQYLALPAAELQGEPRATNSQPTARPGLRGADAGTGSFVIEAYLRANPAHLGGAIVSKMGTSGYELKVTDDGGLSLMLRSPLQISTVEQALVLKDGKWHHILAEVNRADRIATFYIDGRFISSGGPLLADSLSSRAEFWVGRSADNTYFAGDIDFLRISRGTLAEAGTTIEELYAWEFDGPQLRDFAGHKLDISRAEPSTAGQ